MNEEQRKLFLESAKDILLLSQLELFTAYHTVIACNIALGLSEEEAKAIVDEALKLNSEEIENHHCTEEVIKQIRLEVKENAPDDLGELMVSSAIKLMKLLFTEE
jgi:ferritin-like protein